MKAQSFILITPAKRIYCNSESPSSEGAVLWTQPCNLPLWGASHSKVRFDVQVASVGGSPSTWSLGVKFQQLLPHTKGEQYQYPTWIDLDAVTVSSDIEEGQAWSAGSHPAPADGSYGVIASNADTLPVTAKRTLTNFGLGCRIALNPISSGGTTPYLQGTVVATLLG